MPDRSELPRHVDDAIRQIAAMHQTHHAEARPSERLTDRAVSLIGTPTFLAILFAAAAVWIVVSMGYGPRSFDPFPFPMLDLIISLLAILLAVLILAAQRRDNRLATRREQMTLQVGLLTEQKTSKLIDLLMELRRDMPGVTNKLDLEAIEMTAPADHEAALKTVEKDSKPAEQK